MKIEFVTAGSAAGAIAVPAFDKASLSAAAQSVDSATLGALGRAIAASRFKGGAGETLEIIAPAGIDAGRVVIFGLGDKAKLNESVLEKAAAAVVAKLLIGGETAVTLRLDGETNGEGAARAALGARLAAYRFDQYRTKLSDDKKPSLTRVAIAVDDVAAAKSAWANWGPVADGVDTARELLNQPPNILNPETYAKQIQGMAKLGLEIEILDEAQMLELGMHSLLGVGQASEFESHIAIMRWNGGKAGEKPLVFVGKGLTFDSGGISLKPGAGMDEMKGDMGGSAAVVGLMTALSGRKAKVNAIGIVGLVENMPDGNAQRPGDIVTSMSGQTIEILNTDAEGRLVLADVLWYAQQTFDPKLMIDLATLTGAVLIALGNTRAAIFSNDDTIADRLFAAGNASDEPVWRLPLGPDYEKHIETKNADMRNVGEGRLAGSISAAEFLKRFVNDKPWCHIDIAGTAMGGMKDDPRQPSWGTGWGVRMLDRFVRDNYEG
ncbi:leucyl aminopeptidase [Maricaulis salignorans]|uniref:Probable cytosol aminopeptidase n=1 Tax=Maricaulis salignorans TaxID=144026 RepID=A0A1G9T3T3_9PROT|nr:leucyl aminopeptidase [Maricaulis salignorans]SDM42286.1 leucyl aminopeptidase [Maricaulis salignorans]